MTNEDGTLHIVYNGEIITTPTFAQNSKPKATSIKHIATRKQFFTSMKSLTAVRNTCEVCSRLRFGTRNKQELFLARDRLRVAALLRSHSGWLALLRFEIKSLLAARAVTPELNYLALPDYLANHATSGEETLFLGVKRLLPGHTLRWRNGKVEIDQYWDLEFSGDENVSPKSDKDYVAEWLEMFRTSVRLRLMADVPLGMFLSGGIDSSAIAAMMSGMVDEPIKTFSVAFHEREANELEYARLVANRFKTDHHEVVLGAEEFFAALPRLVWHEDEPLAHPASVPLYFVSRLAAQHVKVVLTGEGSDEMLAGYYRYRKTVYNLSFGKRYGQWTNESLRKAIAGTIGKLPATSTVRRKLERTFLSLPATLEDLYFDNFGVFRRGMQQEMLSHSTRERIGPLDPYAVIREQLERSDANSVLNELLYADTKTYLYELLIEAGSNEHGGVNRESRTVS